MICIGFNKKHDDGIVKHHFIGTHQDLMKMDTVERKKIANYLEKGIVLLTLLHSVSDGDIIIGAYKIMTDGHSIWPSHLAYYVSAGKVNELERQFFENARRSDFAIQQLTDHERSSIQKFVENELMNIK